MDNEAIVSAILKALGSNRPIVRFSNIDEKPVENGFFSATHDKDTQSGFTVWAFNNGQVKLSFDANGKHIVVVDGIVEIK